MFVRELFIKLFKNLIGTHYKEVTNLLRFEIYELKILFEKIHLRNPE